MKCIVNREKLKAEPSLISDIISDKLAEAFKIGSFDLKRNTLNSLDLNECVFHGIGVYLRPNEKIGRLRAILDSGAILSENFQSYAFDLSNSLSQSPKLNGGDYISICQRQSFLNPDEISESFKMYPSNSVSIILHKGIIDWLDARNEFNPEHMYDWLDGEYRIKDEIPSSYFVGIGLPCRSLEETAQAFKNIRKYSLKESLSNIINSDWYKDLISIESYMKYDDIELPVYSIKSGKPMGNIYIELAKAYDVSIEKVKEISRDMQTPQNQRIGIFSKGQF